MVISIKGRLDALSSSIFEKRLTEIMDQHVVRILVNCSQTDYIGSACLRVMLTTLIRITLEGGKFVLCGLQANIREIFDISGFDTIFEVYRDEEEAMIAF